MGMLAAWRSVRGRQPADDAAVTESLLPRHEQEEVRAGRNPFLFTQFHCTAWGTRLRYLAVFCKICVCIKPSCRPEGARLTVAPTAVSAVVPTPEQQSEICARPA